TPGPPASADRARPGPGRAGPKPLVASGPTAPGWRRFPPRGPDPAGAAPVGPPPGGGGGAPRPSRCDRRPPAPRPQPGPPRARSIFGGPKGWPAPRAQRGAPRCGDGPAGLPPGKIQEPEGSAVHPSARHPLLLKPVESAGEETCRPIQLAQLLTDAGQLLPDGP